MFGFRVGVVKFSFLSLSSSEDLRCVLLGFFGFCMYLAIQNGMGEEQTWHDGMMA